MKPLQIFKPGRHTAVNGQVLEFTDATLRACAAAYDTAKHEAPLVVGHPAMDGPAYGWAKAVAYADGALVAEPDQVEAQFAEMVNAGRFKKISASFYTPDAPANPVPGVYYLRHIGFLGAAAPAVKGLKSASFAGNDEGVIEFADVAPWRMRSIGTVLRSLREWIISKNTIEEADRVIPSYLIDTIESEPEASTSPAYSEHPLENDMLTKEQQDKLATDQEQLKKDRAALDTRALEFAERDTAAKAVQEKTRRAGIREFVTGLVKAGKILPRDKDGLVAYMAGPNEAGVIEFGEGDDKKTVAPADWLKPFLEGLPQQVDYIERSGKDDDDVSTVSFAAPPGYSVDPARLELHSKALAHQGKHPNTTYEAALAAVQ